MPGRRRDWKSPVAAPDTGESQDASFRLWITEGGVHYEACPLWSFLTGAWLCCRVLTISVAGCRSMRAQLGGDFKSGAAGG